MNPRRRRPTTVLGLMVVSTLLLSGVPAAAEAPAARGIDRVCPAPVTSGGPAGSMFPDLGSTHATSITCAADYGIVSGFADGTFRPGQAITRGQMASFVEATVRTATGLGFRAPDEPHFTDTDGDVHADAIDAIAEAGLVGGRPDGTFGPDETLTRGQFTRVVANAISYADIFAIGGPLPPEDSRVAFADVAGTTFEATIRSLGGVGIALGTADGEFRPRGDVTRGQLTTFLMRAGDYLDRYQRWRPTARTHAVLVTDLDLVAADDGEVRPSRLRGSATLTVNAFNGTLSYSLDLSDLPGPFEPAGATLHGGDPVLGGAVALTLADASRLKEDVGGIVTDVVLESDSSLRFADLVSRPGDHYLEVATTEVTVRGALRNASD